MDLDTAIYVDNLSKVYKLYDNHLDRVKEALNPFGRKFHKDFHALKDVSFEVKKGETVGIIGTNGSGKSTLLQIITGILIPTSGNVEVNGKVSALLELGAGFNPEFTGLQNIYFNGSIMGYGKEEMDEKLDDILSFADIGDFVHQPVKMYSSGMFVRLAFSVATNINPEILIVDEALSVGDMFFQAKSMMKMKKMIDDGATLLFVSHDVGAIKSICKKSLLLDKGCPVTYDSSDKVVEQYFSKKVASEQTVVDDASVGNQIVKEDKHDLQEMVSKRLSFKDNVEFKKRASFQRIQNGKASFANVQLLDCDENEIESVIYDQNVILRMAIAVLEDIPLLAFAYHIRDKNGVDVVYSDTLIENKLLYDLNKGDEIVVDWKFRVSLMHGKYNVACIASIPIEIEIGKVDICDFAPLAVQFEMLQRSDSTLYGLVHWENNIEVEKF